MTMNDLLNAVYFLRKISVGQMDVDKLVQTVEALETEIEKRRKKK
jgi:predicted ATP-grasp superfamily ATP-dependent carboligase